LARAREPFVDVTQSNSDTILNEPGELDRGPGELDRGPGELDRGPGELDREPGSEPDRSVR